jgi:hypothetical protein
MQLDCLSSRSSTPMTTMMDVGIMNVRHRAWLTNGHFVTVCGLDVWLRFARYRFAISRLREVL